MTEIKGKVFDEERALYNLKDTRVKACRFEGPRDGESALKESRNVEVKDCSFSLRYPLWHSKGFKLVNSKMDTLTRAPIWYASEGEITDSYIEGVKCLRECDNISFKGTKAVSPEFGWRCRGLNIEDCEMESEYFLFESKRVNIEKLHMKGKYSFQYVEDMHIKDSFLDTKDAFWHAKNIVVENSTVKGEYLAWYAEDITFINCRIIGTQPLCYCKGLKLVDCTMEETDLSFEYSEVEADIKGSVLSVKNPAEGYITADSIGEIILEDSIMDSRCIINEREKSGVNL
ncbi:MAG: DUF3737 family protein [Ruminococcaceae bacterium]|nr:DUF3737 family protein [Oscillospiraceae bacterium]